MSSPINKETKFISRHFGFSLPELKTSVSPQTRLILMEEAVYDYSGMTDEEIYISDYKEYNLDSYKVGIGCMADKENDIDDFINRMLAVSPDVMKEKGCDMLFAVIDKRVPNPDPAKAKFKPFILGDFYFIYYGEGTKDVAESIFGPSLQEGVIFVETNMPRGQIVNMIDEELW